MPANPMRGDVTLTLGGETRVLRPSFAALAALEADAGPILMLAEAAAAGQVRLAHLAAAFHHLMLCGDGERPSADAVGEMILAEGMAPALRAYRCVLEQILTGFGHG